MAISNRKTTDLIVEESTSDEESDSLIESESVTENPKKTTNSTLTFSFLGTGHNSEERVWFFSLFHKYINAPNLRPHQKNQEENPVDRNNDHYKMLFDGLGSMPSKNATSNHTPGTYRINPETRQQALLPAFHNEMTRALYAKKAITDATGAKAVQQEALDEIIHLDQQGKLSRTTTINLCGHSRGADTAVRVANLLNIYYPDIEVNLFLVDDVPGKERGKTFNSKFIGKNVKHIVSVVALDENKPFFAPQDHSRFVFESPETTVFEEHHMHGLHGLAGIRNGKKEYGFESAYLIRDLLISFAKKHGTAFKNPEKCFPLMIRNQNKNEYEYPNLEDSNRLFLYFKMQMDAKNGLYKPAIPLIPERRAAKNREIVVKDHDFFINTAHRELFKKLYPAFFDYYFQKNIEKKSKEDVQKDIEDMHKHPDIWEAVKAKMSSVDLIHLDRPTQNPYIVHDEYTRIIHAISSFLNYVHHIYPNDDKYFQDLKEKLTTLRHADGMSSIKSYSDLVDQILLNANQFACKKYKSLLTGLLHPLHRATNTTILYITQLIKSLNTIVPRNKIECEIIEQTLRLLDSMKDQNNIEELIPIINAQRTLLLKDSSSNAVFLVKTNLINLFEKTSLELGMMYKPTQNFDSIHYTNLVHRKGLNIAREKEKFLNKYETQNQIIIDLRSLLTNANFVGSHTGILQIQSAFKNDHFDDIIRIARYKTNGITNTLSNLSFFGFGGRSKAMDTIYHALAEFNENYSFSPLLTDLSGLIRAQQKRDAIKTFTEEFQRLACEAKRPSNNHSASLKMIACKALINYINDSRADIELHTLLETAEKAIIIKEKDTITKEDIYYLKDFQEYLRIGNGVNIQTLSSNEAGVFKYYTLNEILSTNRGLGLYTQTQQVFARVRQNAEGVHDEYPYTYHQNVKRVI